MTESGRAGSRPRLPPELRQRAVRMVFETAEEAGGQLGAGAKVARTLGINRETLRRWVRQAEIEDGQRAGLVREERVRLQASVPTLAG